MVSMIQALKNFFKNYINFTGKATRAEYWWVVLWGTILSLVWSSVTVGIYAFLQSNQGNKFSNFDMFFENNLGFVISWGMLSFAVILALIIPGLSLTARRYRDTGINELWVWVAFVMNLASNYTATNDFVNFITYVLMLIVLILTLLPTNIFLNNRLIGRNK